jgi:hypothetical protein
LETVFVYSDMQIGLRNLPAALANQPVYREVKQRPYMSRWNSHERPEALAAFDIDNYTNRGRMFDGRPIFCADGIDVKLLGTNYFISMKELEFGSTKLAQLMLRQAEREVEQAMEPSMSILDQELRTDRKADAHIQRHALRRLVAVKV